MARCGDDPVEGWFEWRVRRQLHEHQRGIAKHDGEQVVEIVRYSPGQHPKALEFLRLEKLALERKPLFLRLFTQGQIPDRCYPNHLSVVWRGLGVYFSGEGRAIFAQADRSE